MAPSGENDPILDLAATLVEAWPRLTAEQQAALVLAAVDDRYGAGCAQGLGPQRGGLLIVFTTRSSGCLVTRLPEREMPLTSRW